MMTTFQKTNVERVNEITSSSGEVSCNGTAGNHRAALHSPGLWPWVSLLILSLGLSVNAATYYIDLDSGSDSNSGLTQAAPFKSLPGSRTASNSGYVTSSYGGGTFTTSAKVPAGTVFKLKRGTSWTSSDGGWIQIDSTWYDNGTAGSPITIQADTTWGSGVITINGTGMTLPTYRGLINIANRKYFIIDGGVTSGIYIRNSPWNGIRVWDNGINGLVLRNLELGNAPRALVQVYSDHPEIPQYISNITIDNVIAHDSTGSGDTDSVFLLNWLDNFVVKNCTAYNSGLGSDGIHLGSSHYGWVLNCLTYNSGEQGIDLSRDGDYKTRDDSYYITVRDCISHDNRVNNFDHNSGSHHMAWINCFAWKTTSGESGDSNFNVHQGTAGPNWWINCSSSKSFDRGLTFGFGGNPWSIPNGDYPQYIINWVSSGDSTYTVTGSRGGSLWIAADEGALISSWQVVNSILNTTSANYGTVNYKGTIFSPANVSSGSGGWSAIGTATSTGLPAWLTPNATTWALSNETPGAGSPAINAGAWVFKANGSGSGSTALTVTNAYGLKATNVFRIGDSVQIQGGPVVALAGVSGNGSLTLATPSTWSSANGVWFNYGGTAPLIGAAFAGASTQLGFSGQPSPVVAGSVIAPPVTVTAYSGGVRDSTYTGNVTVAIGTNPGAGTLGGTLTKAAFAGIATFDNLTINNSGNGYTLTATATGYSSATSAAFNVTPVVPVTPSVPVLVSPSNGASGQSTTPTLTWNSSANSTSYDVQVATDAGFSSVVASQSSLAATSYVPSPVLLANTTYYWRVRGRNSGGTSAYSAAFSFSTALPAPAVPVLVSPADLATGVALNPTLTWGSVSFAATYRIQVATDSGFSSLVFDQTQTATSAAPSLSAATLYYWRVRSQNATGNSAYATTRSFTTSPPPAPAAPTLGSPSNGATDQSITPTLSWNSSATATSYRIQVATDAGFVIVIYDVASLTALSFVPTLLNNTTYYWHVLASNAGGNSAYSSTRSFTTIAAVPPVPGAPALASPADTATGVDTNPTLTWNASSGATSYRIQVATDAGFVTVISDQAGLTSLSFAPVLVASTVYYWHVNASNSGGTSAYSATRSFTTAAPTPPPAPPVPTLWNPANGAVDQETSLTLSWTGSIEATSYHLQVSTVANFASTVVNVAGVTDQFYTTPALAYGTLHYWRVLASNSGGDSAYTAARTFTTEPAVPAAPVLSSPANGATGQSTSPVLTWLSSAGASSYGLQVATDAGFTALVVNLTGIAGLTYTPTGLATSTTFYWRVNGANSGGVGSYSGTRTFTTVPTVPAVPALSSPSNGATGVSATPSLTWTASPGATSYHVQVATDAGFTALVVDVAGISSVSYSPSLSSATLYYWRVLATNSGGSSAYSGARTLTTVPVIPAPPSSGSPANGAFNQPSTLILSWTASPGATSYRLQVSTVANFASTVIDSTGISTTSYTATLAASTTYYWRLSASNAGGTSSFSPGVSFATAAAGGGGLPIVNSKARLLVLIDKQGHVFRTNTAVTNNADKLLTGYSFFVPGDYLLDSPVLLRRAIGDLDDFTERR